MAVPFVRLGLGVADKLVDMHFDKLNDDLFTSGRRKKGLKRLATPRKKNTATKSDGLTRAVGKHEQSSTDSEDNTDDDEEYSERGVRGRDLGHRRESNRSGIYRSMRSRSVDQYGRYNPEVNDYIEESRSSPMSYSQFSTRPYAQDPYAQERPSTYLTTKDSRSREMRPRLQKRSSSVGSVRRKPSRQDERSRKVNKWDKEAKLSMLAAGVFAGGAVLLGR